MGNCLRHKQNLAQDDQTDGPQTSNRNNKEMLSESCKDRNVYDQGRSISDREESKVAARIKVVVTKEELRQILSYKKGCSVEQLVDALKLRGRRVCQVSEGDQITTKQGINRSWRPALESIPEDY